MKILACLVTVAVFLLALLAAFLAVCWALGRTRERREPPTAPRPQ